MADISDMDLGKMKVPELKLALKDRGLPVSGTKAELIKRLGEAMGTSIDATDDGLEASLQGIDDILNDDPVPVTKTSAPKAAPASPVKSIAAPAKTAVKPPQKTDAVSANGVTAQKDTKTSGEADSTHVGKPAEVAKLSNEERLKLRAEKFGVASADAKKAMRAQRFGLPTSGSGTSGCTAASKLSSEDLERLKKRADRFGTVVSTSLSKADENERKKKRAERFGIETNTASTKRPIGINSTDPDNDAKKKKRAERFGLAT